MANKSASAALKELNEAVRRAKLGLDEPEPAPARRGPRKTSAASRTVPMFEYEDLPLFAQKRKA
jgi:hypothetical protein